MDETDWEEEELAEPDALGQEAPWGENRATLCRRLADWTLRQHKVLGPPVPVHEIARNLGFAIRISDLPSGVDARMRIINSVRTIDLAKGQAETRHRFSVAHELGHRILKHEDRDTKAAEAEANIFAGALLVPRRWLTGDVQQYRNVDALAQRYQVSREVLFIALKDARLLNRL